MVEPKKPDHRVKLRWWPTKGESMAGKRKQPTVAFKALGGRRRPLGGPHGQRVGRSVWRPPELDPRLEEAAPGRGPCPTRQLAQARTAHLPRCKGVVWAGGGPPPCLPMPQAPAAGQRATTRRFRPFTGAVTGSFLAWSQEAVRDGPDGSWQSGIRPFTSLAETEVESLPILSVFCQSHGHTRRRAGHPPGRTGGTQSPTQRDAACRWSQLLFHLPEFPGRNRVGISP
jgi:hypothetical protein